MHGSTHCVTIAAVVSALNQDNLGQYAFIPGLINSCIAAASTPEPSAVLLPGGAALLGLGLATLPGLRRARGR